MIESVTTSLGTIIQWIGTILQALTGESGALAALWPLMAIGIGISVLFLGVKVIKSFTWGT